MQNYQMIKWSKEYGGARQVLTGSMTGVSSGQYAVDLDTVPDLRYGIVPAGTPVLADDAARTVKIHYAFETYAITAYGSSDTSFDVKLKKGYEGSRCVAGMKLGVMPNSVANLSAEVTDVFTVTNVVRTAAAYDVVSVSCSARDEAAQIAAGTVLVELEEKVADSNEYFVKVLPNAYLWYDLAKDPNAVYIYADYLFCQNDGVLLTRRVPPIADVVRDYLRSKDVYIRYSVSKE